MLVEEHRVVVVAGRVEAVFGEVGVQESLTVLPVRGTWRVLRPLPVRAASAGRCEADVADGEVGEFLDPGAGVVEGGEQGRVAAALPGGPVGLGEQAAGLLDGQVVTAGWGCFLAGMARMSWQQAIRVGSWDCIHR